MARPRDKALLAATVNAVTALGISPISPRLVVAGIAVSAATLACPDRASAQDSDSDRPATGRLVLAGFGMAIPTYFLGVAIHEGSHAVAAKLVGAEVVRLRLLPGRHPRNERFYFGYTEIRGRLPPGRKAFFLAAPKMTDIIFLGGYTALVGFDALPDNRYGQLALAVLATGFWIDFAKDIPPFAEHHDMPRLYTMAGLHSEWSRLPWRLVHAAAAAGMAWVIWKGYNNVFADDTGAAKTAIWLLPLARGSF